MARSLIISLVNTGWLLTIHFVDVAQLELPRELKNSLLFFIAVVIVLPVVLTFVPIVEGVSELRRQQSKAQAYAAIALSLIAMIGWITTFAVRG